MITNILLGLILGVIITSFIILNNKINKIICSIKYLIDVLDKCFGYNECINNSIDHLLDRFNKRILVNEEYFNIIKDLLNNRFKDVDNANDSIYDRLNNIDCDVQNRIIVEHKHTREEIKKQAKISSKIKSNTKTKKNIDKQ